jgi:hypothetical protein
MKVVEINGIGYELSPLGGVSAARVLLPAMRLAPALLEAGAALTAGKYGRASVALQAAQEGDLATLIDMFQRHTKVLSRAPNATASTPAVAIPLAGIFDQHFTGKINDQLRWIYECFQLNFADFLEDMSPAKPPTAAGG